MKHRIFQQNSNMNKDNQQEIIEYHSNVSSSETVRRITFQFHRYKLIVPEHKKSIALNQSFLEWFIGFVEADGSFIVSAKGSLYFDLTQHLEDTALLYKIRSTLGFGKVLIRAEPARNVAVYYVTGQENFRRLIHLFNGNLVSHAKKTQFEKWLQAFNLKYKCNVKLLNQSVEPCWSNGWLSGFIDGEGSLSARVKYCRTSRLKANLFVDFALSQKEKEVLVRIHALFKLAKDKNIAYDSTWQGFRFYLSNKKLLKPLITYLTRYPLKTRKSIRFKAWKKLHQLGSNKMHLKPEGLMVAFALCERLQYQKVKKKS